MHNANTYRIWSAVCVNDFWSNSFMKFIRFLRFCQWCGRSIHRLFIRTSQFQYIYITFNTTYTESGRKSKHIIFVAVDVFFICNVKCRRHFQCTKILFCLLFIYTLHFEEIRFDDLSLSHSLILNEWNISIAGENREKWCNSTKIAYDVSVCV